MMITIRQLQAIHYYYFCMGIFSLASAFFLGFETLFSVIFLGFYASNSLVAWYVAHVSRKRMKDYVVVQSKGFAINHVISTVLTVLAATGIWSSGLIPDVGMLNTLIMVNYMVMFLAGMWYVITRTDLTKGILQLYDNRVFSRSKKFIIRVREAHWKHFGRHLVPDRVFSGYKYGSVKEVDENMISAWKNKSKTQYVLECLARIEMALARKGMAKLKEQLNDLKRSPPSPYNNKLIRETEAELATEQSSLLAYEKQYYQKTSEGKFL